MADYKGFTENQLRYLRKCAVSWLNVAEGGKRAGKNVVNILAWSACLETHPDRLHLAAGVSIGTAKMNILDSNGFGLRHLFRGRCRSGKNMEKEALYISTGGGEKMVIFAGGGKSSDAALIKGNTFGSAYITEANECHQTFLQEVLDRTLSSSRRQIFMDLNPKAPRHWFYTDFLDWQDKLREQGRNDGYNYAHFTIADNLAMSDAMVRELLDKYDQGSIWFRADILGQRTASTGRIYTSYDREKVLLSGQHRYREYTVGIDVGGRDATVATLIGLTYDMREVHVLDGLYHHQGISDRMSETRYVDMIVNWLKMHPEADTGTIYVDSAAKLFRRGLEDGVIAAGLRFSVRSFDKRDGILERIALEDRLLVQGRIRIAPHLEKWHEALQMAVWDGSAWEKGEWVRLDDGSYPLDCLDSMEYGLYPLKQWIA